MTPPRPRCSVFIATSLEGVPLFGPGVPERRLVLEEARAFASGLAQLRYRLDRAHTGP